MCPIRRRGAALPSQREDQVTIGFSFGVQRNSGLERVKYCFESGPPEPDGMSTTCMLMARHKSGHVWTRYDKIRIKLL